MANTKLTLLTLNVRGLNNEIKQECLLRHLSRYSPSIVCLQEIYLQTEKAQTLKKSWVGAVYTTNFSQYILGVIILVAKNCPIQIDEVQIDKEERYIRMTVRVYNKQLIIVNSYAPTKNAKPYLLNLLAKIETEEGNIVWMGDFNLLADLR